MNQSKVLELGDKVAYRTATQGVNGEYWYYEAHWKGYSAKFIVPENDAKKLGKVVEVSKLVKYLI